MARDYIAKWFSISLIYRQILDIFINLLTFNTQILYIIVFIGEMKLGRLEILKNSLFLYVNLTNLHFEFRFLFFQRICLRVHLVHQLLLFFKFWLQSLLAISWAFRSWQLVHEFRVKSEVLLFLIMKLELNSVHIVLCYLNILFKSLAFDFQFWVVLKEFVIVTMNLLTAIL